ncbi:serine/threonine-protein phosphatase 6 regulatory subunit 3 isoform X2 [Thalassophryne amazonica]|uniref:serine/threonine-protein phosphatase 6 regulatory subunit 3 isoform X2 n=1 Tax=Thalassophryne amazonica TaxID=390379 RepID=UPI0014708EFB|nr:serine/threonine-protein phosphatase 6 regulatory subunit 3 isoform X2 [Thalassophryne amazonica]
MFWKFDLHTTSHIDTLLEKEDVMLTEVMDEDDVLQECKAQNHKLVDFLLRPQCMEDLVTYITQEPSTDVEEKVKYKYPNISCELLTSDVSQINDRLGEDEKLLMKLYGFLQNEPPLNPLLASFFSKVLSILIGRKPEQIVEFLRKREDFVDLMIKHIGTSAIMDLLLRMLTCIEPQQLRQDVLNWLNEEKVIQRLVDMVQSSQDEDKHSNASQSLCEIIRLSRDQMFQVQGCSEPDPLLATLEKQETVEQLLCNIFDKEKNESAIVSVIQILLTLFETRRPAFEGHMECPPGISHPSFSVNHSILEAVRPRLKNFHQLLLEPPKKNVMKTTWGVLDPPVGNTRLSVVKLVASLLQSNTHSINTELINLNTLDVILDMYFKYIWNNFLHIQVEICTAMILAMPPAPSEIQLDTEQECARESILIKHLFQKCRFIQRVVDAWTSNEKEQAEGGRRRGYMGHLTRIANSIVHNCEKGPNGPQIQQLISELPVEDREKWEAFISGQLADTNKRNTVDLVNTHHIHSSSDDEVDFKDSGFHQDSSLQQAFSDYQMQQMTSNFIEQFGFNDEEFADQDDVVDIPFDRISDINFSLNTNESANIALFEARCKEKIQQFEDAGSDEEDIWDEKDVTFAPEAQRRPRSSGSTDSEESTDSEDDDVKRDPFEASNPSTDDRMEVDTGPVWTANFDDIPMDTGTSTAPASSSNNSTATAPLSSPTTEVLPETAWSSSATAASNSDTGWADFSNFTPVSPKDPLRSNSPVAMETSIETVDPLGVNAPMQPDDCDGWLTASATPPFSSKNCGSIKVMAESACCEQRSITETVINGSMKETVSLTVDAKTETAIFKRVLKSYRDEETSGSSEKYSVVESLDSERTSLNSSACCPKTGEKCRSSLGLSNGPLEEMSTIEEAKLDQIAVSTEAAVNGPV